MNGDARGKILFVATEDWFFASHFLPMARAAVAAGFTAAVACRVAAHRTIIEAAGCRVIDVAADRGSLDPRAVARTIGRLRDVFGAERPDLVHLIALRSIVAGGLAARLAGIGRRVIAVTGLGFLGAGDGPGARVRACALRLLVRTAADGPDARYLFENAADGRALGIEPASGKAIIVGGAGVDPAIFAPVLLPPTPPLRLLLVSRMLWSKGIDLAVAAVQAARAAGVDVKLTLAGAPDPANPRAIPEETLLSWAEGAGIRWIGPVGNERVPALHAAHHAAILPSRGGEGLPRSLLEAAACGRAIVTTAVPGCADFVRDGSEGLVVPPDDVPALTAAIVRLASDAALAGRLGAGARLRVLDGYTEDAVGRAVARLYQDMVPAPASPKPRADT